jgi:alpha-ketoglutaric semialdehyde dehydrogenase
MNTFRNYVGGQWIDGRTYVDNVNPSDVSDVIGRYAHADGDQCRDAVAAAKLAFAAWRGSGIQQRCDLLDAIGNEILACKAALSDLLAREEGKTLVEALGEVTRAAQIFKFFAGEALRIPGERMASVRPGIHVEVTREPIGVIGLITPWNFPIAIPAWKMAPALAYGNTVVLKPAELTPGCAWELVNIMHKIIGQAGVPAGVVNLVMGEGPVAGQALIEHPDVAAVSFTGSVATGRHVRSTVAGRGGKVQLEMGGKNPQVVLADADMNVAVNCALQSAFFSTGQRCTASSRLIVEAGIHDVFVDALGKAMGTLRIGDARHADTQIGPLADERQLRKSLDYIELGKGEGAHLYAGGEPIEAIAGKRGFYLSPALLTRSSNDMRTCREEIFGPVASVIRVSSYEEALQVANDTDFGLSAGIATTSLKYAEDFKRRSSAGMVMVNLPTAGVDYHVPFGGAKGSSYGSREQGRYALEFYTTVKTAYVGAGTV